MFLKALISLSILFFVNCDDCDKTKCPEVPKHYDELNCKAVVDDGQCCASRYDCPNFSERDNKKCYFRGNTYKLNEGLDDLTSNICWASCFCTLGNKESDPFKFLCAQIECGEWFNPTLKDCIGVRSFESCCAIRHICDKEEKDKLATCYVDGIEFREGQKMYPDEAPCLSCLCTNDFDNSTFVGNKNCAEGKCDFELRNEDKIKNGCVPVYSRGLRCCPSEWKCPETEDSIIKSDTRQSDDVNDPHMTCKYGDKVLKIGDGISDTDKCVTCKCLLPPMVQCTKTYEC